MNEAARNILVNKAGELAIPFKVSGTAKEPKVAPAAKEAGKELLRGLFGN